MTKSPDILAPAPPHKWKGLVMAIAIIASWALVMFLAVFLEQEWSWWNLLLFPVAVHLYTGLFITAHDGMHGLIHPNASVNKWVSTFCLWLFAFNRFSVLYPKHHLHHAHPAQEEDPDFAPFSFWRWYVKFLLEYVSIAQVVMVALVFNLGLWAGLSEVKLIMFYAVAPILSTLQLFYFGTYLPHRGEHSESDQHRARSQPKNHLVAFITCYFFGYHHEHHAAPWLAWWQLPQLREVNEH